jgi:hypothetical protein
MEAEHFSETSTTAYQNNGNIFPFLIEFGNHVRVLVVLRKSRCWQKHPRKLLKHPSQNLVLKISNHCSFSMKRIWRNWSLKLTTFHSLMVLSVAVDARISPVMGVKRTHITLPPWPVNWRHNTQSTVNSSSVGNATMYHSFTSESLPQVASR